MSELESAYNKAFGKYEKSMLDLRDSLIDVAQANRLVAFHCMEVANEVKEAVKQGECLARGISQDIGYMPDV